MQTAVEVLAEYGFRPGLDGPPQDDFLEACEAGLVDVVRAYLDLGMPIACKGTQSKGPALLTAAEAGSIAVVELLIERGADLEQHDDWGDTALRTAVNWKHAALVRRLVELGASLDAPNQDGESALEHAIVEDEGEHLELLLELGANPSFVCRGRSAVRAAITRGSEAALYTLLDHGASAALVLDDHGVTALHEASRSQSSSAVELLLAHGADRSARDAYGLTALDYALEVGAEQLAALLGEPTPQQRARARMWQQLANGVADAALATLEREDLSIETRNSGHRTPLLALSEAGHVDGVKRLLARGANPAPPRVATAVSAAIGEGHGEVLELLLAAGAPVFDAGGKLPGLANAVWDGHASVVRRVLEASTREQRAGFAEHVGSAVMQGHVELVRIFIEHGVPLGQPSSLDGETALMRAVSSSFSAEIATLLLDAGAALDAVDADRRETALHKLVEHHEWDDDREPVLRELLARGARLDAINWQDKTPFDAAQDAVKPILLELAVVERIASDPPIEAVVPGQSWATLPMFDAAGLGSWVLRLIDAGVAFEPPPGPDAIFDHAVDNNDVALVEALIARGADVNRRTSYGSTPLLAATSRGEIEITKLLLAAGAHVDDASYFGFTAAHEAASHPELLPLLASAGARFDQRVYPPIIQAARVGNATSLEFFLAHGAVLDGVGPHGATALATAITEGHEAIALRLIAAGASPTRRTHRQDELPITAAAKRGQVAVVKALLAAGASPTDTNPAGESALTIMARRNELRETFAELLAQHGADVAVPRFERLPTEVTTVTPAWAALYGGDRWAVAKALDAGELGIDDRDPWGATPLMVAVQIRAADLVAVLLERSADPLLEDPSGSTAWDYGGFWKRDDSIDLALERRGVKRSIARLDGPAARSLLRDEIQGYLDRGEHAKIVAAIRDRRLHPLLGLNARSLVIDAIERNDCDLLAALIDLGLPLELCSVNNWTPLNTALTRGRLALAQQLADAGVNTRIPGLLQSFLNFGNAAAADWMLAHGLDLRTPDDNGDLPIHEAVRYGQAIAVQLMLERDPAVRDARDRSGGTPLMCAVENWSSGVKVVTLLLEAGADVHAVDHAGKTALHKSIASFEPKATKLLMSWGARWDATAEAELAISARAHAADLDSADHGNGFDPDDDDLDLDDLDDLDDLEGDDDLDDDDDDDDLDEPN